MQDGEMVQGSKKGMILSFEGIDASGKNTQSRMLFEFLTKDKGVKAQYISFPDYDTAVGREISAFLSGKKEYSIETRHLLYAVNRYEKKELIQNWLEEGNIIIANRYCDSNLAYGVASGLPLKWLEQVESLMPQADYIFLLKVAPQVSGSRKAQRDKYEADLNFLSRVSNVYDELVEPGKWFRVDSERPKDIIHYEISSLAMSLIDDESTSKLKRGVAIKN